MIKCTNTCVGAHVCVCARARAHTHTHTHTHTYLVVNVPKQAKMFQSNMIFQGIEVMSQEPRKEAKHLFR